MLQYHSISMSAELQHAAMKILRTFLHLARLKSRCSPYTVSEVGSSLPFAFMMSLLVLVMGCKSKRPAFPPSVNNVLLVTCASQVFAGKVGYWAGVAGSHGQVYLWSITNGKITAGQGTSTITFTPGKPGSLHLSCQLGIGEFPVLLAKELLVLPQRDTNLVTSFYGPGINADALANVIIGGPLNRVTDCRFRSDHSGLLNSVRVYLTWDTANRGYSSGSGGAVLLTLQTDDNTVNHFPAATTLGSILYRDPLHNGYFPLFTFQSPPALVSGSYYHLVFSNPDPDPTNNYVSINSLLTANVVGDLRQPTKSDSDWAQFLGISDSPGSWVPRDNFNNSGERFTPIVELDYSDAFSTGVGYIDVWPNSEKSISAGRAVRETFTVDSDRTLLAAALRVRHVDGSGVLVAQLEMTNGVTVEEDSVWAVDAQSTYSWVTIRFATVQQLRAGNTYHLVFRAAEGTKFLTFPIRKGSSPEHGFKKSTYFADGFAQYFDGLSWRGWDPWQGLDRTDGDLQFYFVCVK